MRLSELVLVSEALKATRSRIEKRDRVAALLRATGDDEIAIATAFLIGEPRQGRFGVGWASLDDAEPGAPVGEGALTLVEVDRALAELAALGGEGSRAERRRALEALLGRATSAERTFLAGMLLGNLRQGALEGVMEDAIARAFDVPIDDVRRAHMLSASLPEVARIARSEASAGLAGISFTLFRPVLPMLASPAEDVEGALAGLGEAYFEPKLDGVRLQIHRAGEDVAVYTRGLEDVTRLVPEVVATARALPGREIVLDAEAIAMREDGRPHPFQITMRRFGRRMTEREEAKLTDELPLTLAAFDALWIDGESLLAAPTTERLAALDARVPESARLVRLRTSDAAIASARFREIVDAGHEGLVVKALDAPYAAGRRGKSWLKLKRVHTLDLVVIAVEWGSGRREGTLSNLHLGARDPSRPGHFVMLGKTFKGLTDELLAWQTRELLAREVRRERHVVHVRPELVVEIAFDGVQESPRYPAKMALRFARVKRYRPDKTAAEADTIDTVRAIHDHARDG